MLKRMRDMPAGTLGLEAVGEVDDDDVELAAGLDAQGSPGSV
jgi:hypothetical protein